jgi:two-component system, cell cycle sensor histidine kinase and response regulator CckA
MLYFSYLHLLCAQIYIILAVIILLRDRNALLNRLCSVLFLCFFVWSFSWTFFHNPYVSRKTAILFLNVSSIGWLLFSPFFLWFSIVYTKRKQSAFLLVLLFSFPLFLIFRQFTGQGLNAQFSLRAYGWFVLWRHSIWVYLFSLYYFMNVSVSAFLILNFRRKSNDPLINRQSTILVISFLIPLTLGTVSNMVLPLLNFSALPPIADVFIISWAAGLTYAVWRYRLLGITPVIAADQIVAAMKDLLLLLDMQGKILSINQATLDVLEYDRDELEGKPVEMIFSDSRTGEDDLPATIRSSTLSEYEIVFVAKGGNRIPVSLSTSTLPDRGIVCVAHDISIQQLRAELLREEKEMLEDKVSNAVLEQKKTTAQLLQETTQRIRAVKAREESEQRFKTIFEFAPDGFYLMDHTGRFVDCNREAERITGYKKEEVIGKDLSSLKLVASSHLVNTAALFSRNIQGRPTGPDEVTFNRKDGSRVPLEISTFPMIINERHLTLGIARDISLRKKNEEEKQLLREELNQVQKLEAVGQLAGGIAHDFNNLLGGIIGYADLLRIKLAPAFPAESSITEKIISVARQAAQLTAQLLAFARKGKYQVAVIDIHKEALDVIGILERTINKKIQIATDFHASPSTIMGDRSQIQNALLNLGVNSRDAMPDGGKLTFKTDTIEIGEDFTRYHPYEAAPGTYLKISVIDTGTGMNEETKKRAFDPFFTTKESGKGTGLGLASVYGTIKNHNGFIELFSETGIGTTMVLCLPVTNAPADTEPVSAASPGTGGQTGTILIVDDEPVIREMACEALEIFGYKTLSFGKAGKAIDHYRDHHGEIDLVILDLSMPEISGAECYAAMKAINPAIKTVVASGHAMDDAIGRLLADGVLGFLPKPFDLDKLTTIVKKTLH